MWYGVIWGWSAYKQTHKSVVHVTIAVTNKQYLYAKVNVFKEGLQGQIEFCDHLISNKCR